MTFSAFGLANAAAIGFVAGWAACRLFMVWRDRRKPPPF